MSPDLLSHVFGGNTLALRYATATVARRDNFEVIDFFVLIQLVNVIVVNVIIEIITSNTGITKVYNK